MYLFLVGLLDAEIRMIPSKTATVRRQISGAERAAMDRIIGTP
jgi:hypothetical protein